MQQRLKVGDLVQSLTEIALYGEEAMTYNVLAYDEESDYIIVQNYVGGVLGYIFVGEQASDYVKIQKE
jgi:hypothetical protein